MTRHWSLLAIIFLGLVSALSAQSVYWSPAGGTLQRGKENTLKLVFDSCKPTADSSLPNVNGLQLEQAGTETSSRLVNGQRSDQLIVKFRAMIGNVSQIRIPALEMVTSAGKLQLPAVTFKVIDATVGDTGAKPEDVFSASLQIGDRKIYQGEVFDLNYQFLIQEGINVNQLTPPTLDSKNLVAIDFTERTQAQTVKDGKRHVQLDHRTKALATESGEITLPPISSTVSVVVGRDRGFSFFGRNQVENINISSKPVNLTVHPLPENAPESFYGAVGAFELESNIVPQDVQVGEPVTWTLRLEGTGNWPAGLSLPPRSVSKDFRAIQPQFTTDMEEGNPFVGTYSEDIVLIPTGAGEYQLGPLDYTFFNPQTEQYETIEIPATKVNVSAVTEQSIDPNAMTQTDDSQSAPTDASGNKLPEVQLDPSGVNLLTKTIDLPAPAIIEQATEATAPRGTLNALKLLWTPIPALLIWLLVALARSLYFDKNAAQRKALSTLKSIKQSLIDDRETQLTWRDATTTYWKLTCLEPSAAELEKAVSAQTDIENAQLWKSLWLRSDSLLYGKETSLGDSWNSDLQDALKRAKKPTPSLSALGRSIAWKASLVAITLLSLSTATTLDAESHNERAQELYDDGSFSKSADAWDKHIKDTPGDWTAFHNAGLAHAQQDDWGKALGYWTSAFVLQPQNESIRWNLKLALNRSGSFDPKLTERISDKRTSRIATQLAPNQWESYADTAMTLTTVLFVLIVASLYFAPLKKLRWAFWSIAFICAAFVVVADWAVQSYGILAEPEALILVQAEEFKSLPTDAEVEQISTQLSEGAIALPRKTLFGWTQIELPNGEIGWVRSEALMPLYSQAI